MKGKTGKETKKLMLSVTLSVLALLICIIAYFMLDVIVTTNRNMEEDKEKLIAASVSSLRDMKTALTITGVNSKILKLFNPEIVDKILAGNVQMLYEYGVDIALSFYPVDYVGIINGGKLVHYGLRGGMQIDPGEMPVRPPQGDYATHDELFGRKGFFISVFMPLDLSAIGIGDGDIDVNMIVDRTRELAAIEEYFSAQRNNLIIRLSIISATAIVLSILLTTIGLLYLTRRYVVRPIEDLNRTAEEIADGVFTGEVQVDGDSAYAALQGLLRSGQKVLQHMGEGMKA